VENSVGRVGIIEAVPERSIRSSSYSMPSIPSPFRDKDLDPKAEEFIVGWAKVLPVTQRLLWWWISTGGRVTQRGCCATRRDSRVLQSTS
jgi:hypothetical protein